MTSTGQPAIGRLSTSGSFSSFSLPAGSFSTLAPRGIAAGKDGALWFTESGTNRIGRMTTAGQFSEISIPTANSGAGAIVAGDGRLLWFVETTAGKVASLRY
jgi:virginiamycin B lyase